MKTKKSGKHFKHSLSVKTGIVTGIALVLFAGYFLYGQVRAYIVGQQGGQLVAVQDYNFTKAYGWQVNYPKLGDEAFDEKIVKIVNDEKAGFLARVDFENGKLSQNDLNISYKQTSGDDKTISVLLTIRKSLHKDRSEESHEIAYDRMTGELSWQKAAPPRIAKDARTLKGEHESTRDYCAEKKCLALTFDGGPSGETDRILDVLKSQRSKATFFVQGAQADRYPATLKRIVAAGYEVGNNTYSGLNLQALPYEEAIGELNEAAKTVRDVSGKAPALARAPFASMTPELAKRIGVPFVGWDIATNEWNMPRANQIYDHVLTQAKAGSIVKADDTSKVTVDAYERIIPELKNDGFELVTVSQLLGFDDTTPPGVY